VRRARSVVVPYRRVPHVRDGPPRRHRRIRPRAARTAGRRQRPRVLRPARQRPRSRSVSELSRSTPRRRGPRVPAGFPVRRCCVRRPRTPRRHVVSAARRSGG
jgi:hypothetical protein